MNNEKWTVGKWSIERIGYVIYVYECFPDGEALRAESDGNEVRLYQSKMSSLVY